MRTDSAEKVELWDIDNWKAIATFAAPEGTALKGFFRGQVIVSQPGRLQLVDPFDGTTRRVLDQAPGPVSIAASTHSVVVSSNGEDLAFRRDPAEQFQLLHARWRVVRNHHSSGERRIKWCQMVRRCP